MAAQSPTFLANQELRLSLFGGKGGVGKTTVAAASSWYAASRRPEAKVLIISTDPAHSLSDSFDQEIGDQVTPIEGWPNLWAWEMNAQRVYRDFMAQYGEVIKTIADRGTYFDREDINDFLSLALPGQDEMMALREIARVVRQNEYTLIVIDTAPTGHTLRMLGMPKSLAQWLHVLQLMHRKHRYIVSRLAGRYHKDEVDAFLKEMAEDLVAIQSLLTDPRSTEFIPVTIPESMSIEETHRLLEELKGLRIPLSTIVINRVAGIGECAPCQARAQGQEWGLKEIQERFASYSLRYVPLASHEIRGQAHLREFSMTLLGEGVPFPVPPKPAGKAHREERRKLALRGKELLLFGGKGGVGKTTLAAATALHLAASDPWGKTLLFSIDPAHSLSDSLGVPIGDRVTAVPGFGGLFALEVDAPRLLEEFKEKYVNELSEVWDSFFRGSGTSIAFDPEITEELVNSTPPGVDELMALLKVMDFMAEGRFDHYILDMAPTGHALRFLETPGLVREWFEVFFKIILKYRPTLHHRLDHTARLLVEKSKQLRLVKELLTDGQRSQFVPVTIPEAMAVQETGRLVESLNRLSIRCGPVMVNMVVSPAGCDFCEAVGREQSRYLEELETWGPGCVAVPLFPGSIAGLQSLQQVGEAIYAGGSETGTGRSAHLQASRKDQIKQRIASLVRL